MSPRPAPLRFGFVVHPLGAFQRRLIGVRGLDLPLAVGRANPGAPPTVVARLALEDPFGVRAEGVLVSIPLTPLELLNDQERGVAAVSVAVKMCQAEGAQIVGLGAVAAVIGGQGKAVAAQASCPVSTGNGFTALAAVETLSMLRRLGGARGPVGLLGPPGPVATGALRGLVARGFEVRVVAPNPPKPLLRLAATLNETGYGAVDFVDSVEPVCGPGRVLVAASSTGGRLKLSSLPSGSVVVDVAAPQDVEPDVPPREDVLLLDGEYVRLPGELQGGLWHRIYGLVTGQRRHIFACFAEPMLMALSGVADHCSIGRDVPLERLVALGDLAADHGFWVDRLHERSRPVSPARLRRFLAA